TFTFEDLVIDLGEDGEKNLYATAQIPGYIVSDFSDPYTFILDTTAPKILGVTVEAEGLLEGDEGTLTITFSEEIAEDSIDFESGLCLWDINIVGTLLYGETGILEDPVASDFDLVLPKVLEVKGKLKVDAIELDPEFTLITVGYDYTDPSCPGGVVLEKYITDLAGNKLLDSVHACILEVAE
ncbi:unnamed protein product, partial [marine sediment metagenome]